MSACPGKDARCRRWPTDDIEGKLIAFGRTHGRAENNSR
jgi:hypothetical protein